MSQATYVPAAWVNIILKDLTYSMFYYGVLLLV